MKPTSYKRQITRNISTIKELVETVGKVIRERAFTPDHKQEFTEASCTLKAAQNEITQCYKDWRVAIIRKPANKSAANEFYQWDELHDPLGHVSDAGLLIRRIRTTLANMEKAGYISSITPASSQSSIIKGQEFSYLPVLSRAHVPISVNNMPVSTKPKQNGEGISKPKSPGPPDRHIIARTHHLASGSKTDQEFSNSSDPPKVHTSSERNSVHEQLGSHSYNHHGNVQPISAVEVGISTSYLNNKTVTEEEISSRFFNRNTEFPGTKSVDGLAIAKSTIGPRAYGEFRPPDLSPTMNLIFAAGTDSGQEPSSFSDPVYTLISSQAENKSSANQIPEQVAEGGISSPPFNIKNPEIPGPSGGRNHRQIPSLLDLPYYPSGYRSSNNDKTPRSARNLRASGNGSSRPQNLRFRHHPFRTITSLACERKSASNDLNWRARPAHGDSSFRRGSPKISPRLKQSTNLRPTRQNDHRMNTPLAQGRINSEDLPQDSRRRQRRYFGRINRTDPLKF
jgi:hypothetical protein